MRVRLRNGVHLEYETFGDPKDEPLVLVEGLSAQLLGWHPEWCRMLADEGLFVLRFDNRDVGLSQRVPGVNYSLRDMAADTAGLIEALDLGPAHVVGQSMGGMIAQHLVIDRPELVRSLVLIYTTPDGEHFTGSNVLDGRATTVPRNRDEAGEMHLRDELPCQSPGYPVDELYLREKGRRMFDRGWSADGVARQRRAVLTAPDRTAQLHSVTAPVSIIHGDSDALISPAAATALLAALPAARLSIFPGMGHSLPMMLWSAYLQEVRTVVRRSRNNGTPSTPRRDALEETRHG